MHRAGGKITNAGYQTCKGIEPRTLHHDGNTPRGQLTSLPCSESYVMQGVLDHDGPPDTGTEQVPALCPADVMPWRVMLG
jgi:hypothetical protein